MAEVVQCRYVHRIIHEFSTKHTPTAQRYSQFLSYFPQLEENFPCTTFDSVALRLERTCKRRWHRPHTWSDFTEHFCLAWWTKLNQQQRAVHSLTNCGGCKHLALWYNAFPAKKLLANHCQSQFNKRWRKSAKQRSKTKTQPFKHQADMATSDRWFVGGWPGCKSCKQNLKTGNIRSEENERKGDHKKG